MSKRLNRTERCGAMYDFHLKCPQTVSKFLSIKMPSVIGFRMENRAGVLLTSGPGGSAGSLQPTPSLPPPGTTL